MSRRLGIFVEDGLLTSELVLNSGLLERNKTVTVNRVVANIATDQMDTVKAFYGDVLEMTIVMDHGWIITLAGSGHASPQISFAVEGGSGTPVPDISIEVDDLSRVHQRVVEAGHQIEYGPVTEPWGVRRFFVRDPFGRLLNILSHE